MRKEESIKTFSQVIISTGKDITCTNVLLITSETGKVLEFLRRRPATFNVILNYSSMTWVQRSSGEQRATHRRGKADAYIKPQTRQTRTILDPTSWSTKLEIASQPIRRLS